MARSITEIQNTIFEAITSNPDLTALNSTSKVSIYRLFVFVISYAIWMLEVLSDNHKTQIDTAILEQKSGTPRWYRNMALAFQYGFDLIYDSDQFENIGFTSEQIEASKIIKYCSVKESLESNKLTIKVAGDDGDFLVPLTAPQLESFSEYMQEIKYAGVGLNILNSPADRLILTMDVYRDVLVIDENGTSIKNGGKPIEDAIKLYMKNLPFDGELVLNDLIANLRMVDGVNNVNIVTATASHYDAVIGFSDFAAINVRTVPRSGYFEAGSLNVGVFESGNFSSITYVV
jgi:hypothetical protein